MAYPFFPMISATGATLASYYHRLREHGLNDSHSGNASVRINDNVSRRQTKRKRGKR